MIKRHTVLEVQIEIHKRRLQANAYISASTGGIGPPLSLKARTLCLPRLLLKSGNPTRRYAKRVAKSIDEAICGP